MFWAHNAPRISGYRSAADDRKLNLTRRPRLRCTVWFAIIFAMSKLIFKASDDIRNTTVHRGKSVEYGEPFYVGASLSEEYLRGVLWFHLHGAGKSGKFCAIFKSKAAAKRYVKPNKKWLLSDHRDGVHLLARHNDNRNHPVFVSVVELGQEPQRIFLVPIATSIWLRPLDHCAMAGGNALQSALQPPFIRTCLDNLQGGRFVRPTTATVEIDWISRSFVGRGRVEKCQLPCEIVERGPKQVGNQSDVYTPRGVRWLSDAGYVDLLACIRVTIERDVLNLFVCDEPRDRTVEFIDLVLSSCELEISAIERVHRRAVSDGERCGSRAAVSRRVHPACWATRISRPLRHTGVSQRQDLPPGVVPLPRSRGYG